MERWSLAVGILGLISVLSPRDADACDASGWQIDQQEGECLQIRSVEGTYRAANVCDGALTLTAEVCPAACPEVVEIAPGEDALLELPEDAKNDDKFRFISTEDDVVTLVYVENVCPREDSCSFGKSGSRPDIGVFLIGVATLGFRHLRRIGLGHRRVVRKPRSSKRPANLQGAGIQSMATPPVQTCGANGVICQSLSDCGNSEGCINGCCQTIDPG